MFCPNCGKELKDTSKFCTGCGAAVKRPPVVAQEPIPVETPTPAEPEPVAVNPQLPVVEPAKTIVEPVKQVVDQEKTDNEPKTSGFVHPEIIDVNVGNTNEKIFIEPEPKSETEHKLEEKFVESKKEVGEKAKKSDDKKNVEKKPTNLQTSKKGAVGIVISVIAILLVAGIIIAAVLISDNVFVEEEFNPGDCIDSCDTEDILTTGYWTYGDKDESDILLFRTVDNNETFDGIMIIDEDIIPYIIDDDGKVTGFGYSYYLNEATDSYDWEYWPCVTIAIEENEYGDNYLLVNCDEGMLQADNIDSGSANDMVISLMFSDWSDYYYKPASFDEYEDHTFHRMVTEQAQRDILFLDFYFSEVGIASYEYGDTDAGLSRSDWESEYYSIDVGEKCIYIDDARFDFNEDFTQLYNAEEELTLYRVTDFHLGKIADTDFPPGEFVESYLNN